VISELIKFGKWLDENGQAQIGNSIDDDASIFIFELDDDLSNIEFTEMVSYKEYKKDYSNSTTTEFGKKLYILTGNDSLTNTSGIGGITPFFFKLSNSTFKKGNIKKGLKDDWSEKTKKKVENSIKEGGKNYSLHLKHIIENDNLLKKMEKNEYREEIEKIITQYFPLLKKEFEVGGVVKKEIEKNFSKVSKRGVYLYFKLNENFSYINDIFLQYVKHFKRQNEEIEFIEGECPFCRQKQMLLVYKEIPFYALQKSNYNWGLKEKNLNYAKFKICNQCNYHLQSGFTWLTNQIGNYYLLIPKPKKNTMNYREFLVKTSKYENQFEKINEVINSELSEYFNFDFVVYEGGNNTQIKKYVENYKTFLIKFNDIKLIQDNKLKYLFGDIYHTSSKEKSSIKTMFDLEDILKLFFIDIREEGIVYPKYNHLYEIYTKDLTGKSGIFYKYDSKTVSIFSKYMHNLFNLIYELNDEALTNNMLNEISMNSLIKLEKNNKKEEGGNWGRFDYEIKKRLNYYYMMRKELLGDKMMENEKIDRIKDICNRYTGEDEEKITKEEIQNILDIGKNDPAIKYYLLGKFIKLIEGFKSQEGKQSELFTAYMTNSNRNNLRNLFISEILKKNNYYISRLNPKGKIIFNMIENDANLFSEKNMSYEDYVLFMFTGYYTENILSSNYGKETDQNGGE